MQTFRLGIATADGVSVCEHLARSSAFLILEIRDGAIASRTLRTRGTDTCGQHSSFVELLDGANAVICGGIGQGAADSLLAHGIEPLVVAGPHLIDDAVNHYLAGRLVTTDERVCLCH